jgi:ATP-dependent DNA helicase DinG
LDFHRAFRHANIRPQQSEILDFVGAHWNSKRFFIINAPTGVGKSDVARAIARLAGRSYVLTSTKVLQDQYAREFADMVNLKGRGNYTCAINPAFKVDHAPCIAIDRLKSECIGRGICPYYSQRDKALNSMTMITSYAYFLSAVDCGPLQPGQANGDTSRDLVVCDEGHELEDHLTEFTSVSINPRDLVSKFNLNLDADIRFPHVGVDPNLHVIQRIQNVIAEKMHSYQQRMSATIENAEKWAGDARNISAAAAKQVSSMNRNLGILDRIDKRLKLFLSTHEQDDWIVEPEMDGEQLRITPLTAARAFRKHMSFMGKRFLIMSASIGDPGTLMEELGLPSEETCHISVDTPFPPEESPIYPLAVASLGYRDIDSSIPAVLQAVEAILAEHPNEKGIIHSGNYKLAKAILERSPDSVRQRLIGKASSHGNSNEELVRKHASDPRPTVLVSPSMHTGLDLKDELSRFQIIAKLPWLHTGDPRTRAKMEAGGSWYANQMWVKVIQAAGRSTRSAEDRATTYVLDEQFISAFNRNRSLLPKWFCDRIVW